MSHDRSLRQGEKGNVLFLILIAVALFAALSYAVTQSTRSGSNDAGREQSLISSAQLTQYPAGVRTSLIRMVIGGISADDLYFNTPSDFGNGQPIDDTDGDPTDERRAVFHPAGGGAPYQLASPDLINNGAQQEWIFSGMYEITRIGTSAAGSGNGNDLTAFLPNVSRAVCVRINEELGITGGTDGDGDGVPDGGAGTVPTTATHAMTEANNGFPNEVEEIGSGTGTAFSGQPFGCYDSDDGDDAAPLVYYHVLIER
jgi:hypothetical protein